MTDLPREYEAELKLRRELRRGMVKELREQKVVGAEIATKDKLSLRRVDDIACQAMGDSLLPVSLAFHPDLTEAEGKSIRNLYSAIASTAKKGMETYVIASERLEGLLGRQRYWDLLATTPEHIRAEKWRTAAKVEQAKLDRTLNKTCQTCGVVGAIRQCPCRRVRYCDAQCQRVDWARHKAAEHMAGEAGV